LKLYGLDFPLSNSDQNPTLSREQIERVYELYKNGQFKEAISQIKALNEMHPNVPLLFNLIGACYKSLGKLEGAIKMFQIAVSIKYDYGEAHKNLGTTLKELGRLDESVESFMNAIEIDPSFVDAHYNLGNAFKQLNRFNESVKSYKTAIAIDPNFTQAYNNLGNVQKDLNQLDDALNSYERAIAIDPDFSLPHNNIGFIFMGLGKMNAAIKCFEKAISIDSEYAEAHNNLGRALIATGNIKAGTSSYQKAIEINPNFADAHLSLGHVFRKLKQRDKALFCFERAHAIKPSMNNIFGTLLNSKMHLCNWDDLSNQLQELRVRVNNNEKVIGPFSLMGLIDDPDLQKKASEIFVNHHCPKNHTLPKLTGYSKHLKIRIGYFSADFKTHPTAFLSAELYELHDREQFEVHAFSFGRNTNDEMNLRIKAGVDYFHDVYDMSHKEIVMLSRSLEIDIAIDLGGFTGNSRPKVFAMSAAPIQVNYLVFPGTMCANYIDYIVADHILIPKDKQNHYSEKIVYMPNSYQVNASKLNVSDKVLTRNKLGLSSNHFVFCCFNNAYKITPEIFSSWMRILHKTEESQLWLLANNDMTIENLKNEAVKQGISDTRLVFAPYVNLSEHLNRIKHADLFLDTRPYNAHTTSSDALRMGLPVLTCIGKSFPSRVAASILNSLSLTELITETEEDYESLAIELATNPIKLKSIKDKLIHNLSSAPLFDTPLFARNLESAFKTMYEKHQNGIKPEHIYVNY